MIYGAWHTYNRGVEKRDIFLDKEDFFRGVHDIYELNDLNAVVNLPRRFSSFKSSNKNEGYPISFIRNIRESLLDVFVWCLMPNHYHLFSEPKSKDSLAKFHQKFGIGYTNYFNLKHGRSGVLFQGKYKKVQVVSNHQMQHLICYIHSNPLDLWKPNWKEEGVNGLEIQNALKFLESKENRWSSHQDYLGIKNFPSLINKNFLFNFFGNSERYREFFINWLQQYKKERNPEDFRGLLID